MVSNCPLSFSGNRVVTYTYDAWGNVTVSGTLATTIGVLNPFRYRGYYYDTETGLYYLNSRYYNPEFGRFISADGQLNGGLLGYNQFAYCENNVVNSIDIRGEDAVLLYCDSGSTHLGALIQDSNGAWWHFYWGAKDKYNIINKESVTWCVRFYGDPTDLDSINNSKQLINNYNDLLFLSGDFSQSYISAQNASGLYHIIKNNCAQKTLSILSESNTKYKNYFKICSKDIFPKNAFRDMSDFVVLMAQTHTKCCTSQGALCYLLGFNKEIIS